MNSLQLKEWFTKSGDYADKHHEMHGGWVEAQNYGFAVLVRHATLQDALDACGTAYHQYIGRGLGEIRGGIAIASAAIHKIPLTTTVSAEVPDENQ